jgi:hypothetical protein
MGRRKGGKAVSVLIASGPTKKKPPPEGGPGTAAEKTTFQVHNGHP